MSSAVVVFVVCAAVAGCDRTIAKGVADGKAIYSEACARCHGPVGVPARADVARLGVRDLTQPELQDRLSDADVRGQIVHGSTNQQMPSFAGALTEDQVVAVVAHVRTLRQATD